MRGIVPPSHYLNVARYILLTVIVAGSLLAGSHVEYIGGTLPIKDKCDGAISTTGGDALAVQLEGATLSVPYDRINMIEYGQKVSREYIAAVLISPLFLLAKKRKHFLTVGFLDGDGRQQAMIFRVDKRDIRTVLVSLEARTGRKVVYQDEEARKAGKG